MEGELVWTDKRKEIVVRDVKTFLHLIFSSFQMQIFIKTLVGNTLVLEVQDSDTIASVKAQITKREKVASDHQRLIFDGKQLEDDQTVGDYRIRTDSVLHLVVRPVARQPAAPPTNEVVPQSIFTTIFEILRDLVNGILGFFFRN